MGDDLLAEASRANLRAALARSAERLQAEGIDLAGYTIPEVVEDLDTARAQLGYERIHLLSQSYGTRVAQIYARLHEHHVHRSAMIGVNPPGRFVWEPDTIDEQLRYYSRLHAESSDTAREGSDLAATISQIAHDMPRRWLYIRIDPGKVKVLTFALLFNRATAAKAFDAYLKAAAGDQSGLALLSAVSDLMLPRLFTWGDFFAKGAADFDPARDYASELDPPDSILSSPMSLLFFDALRHSWPIASLPHELRTVRTCATETLLISGTVDFSTPAKYATDELLPFLLNGRQVLLAEMGHTSDVWHLQPEATERLLASFYATGEPDDSLYRYAPMDFASGVTYATLAKLTTAVGVLPALAALAAVRRSPSRT